jgi:hypothetical protein
LSASACAAAGHHDHRRQPLLGGTQLAADALLLGAEHGQIDRAGVGVQQPAALAFQLAHSPGRQLAFAADGAEQATQV